MQWPNLPFFAWPNRSDNQQRYFSFRISHSHRSVFFFNQSNPPPILLNVSQHQPIWPPETRAEREMPRISSRPLMSRAGFLENTAVLFGRTPSQGAPRTHHSQDAPTLLAGLPPSPAHSSNRCCSPLPPASPPTCRGRRASDPSPRPPQSSGVAASPACARPGGPAPFYQCSSLGLLRRGWVAEFEASLGLWPPSAGKGAGTDASYQPALYVANPSERQSPNGTEFLM